MLRPLSKVGFGKPNPSQPASLFKWNDFARPISELQPEGLEHPCISDFLGDLFDHGGYYGSQQC